MNDLNVLDGMSYKEMAHTYADNFSLGYINGGIQDKFALIGLICYVTHKAKQKQPGVTHWHVIKKISEGMNLPERFLMGLSIICDDYSYGCTVFPTFGIEPKEVLTKIKEILDKYMPF